MFLPQFLTGVCWFWDSWWLSLSVLVVLARFFPPYLTWLIIYYVCLRHYFMNKISCVLFFWIRISLFIIFWLFPSLISTYINRSTKLRYLTPLNIVLFIICLSCVRRDHQIFTIWFLALRYSHIGTVDFRSLTEDRSLLRAIYPEASVILDGILSFCPRH